MKSFIVYNALGVILRTGTAPDDMIEMQAREGEFVIEGIADDQRDEVDPVEKRLKKNVKEPPPPRVIEESPLEPSRQLDVIFKFFSKYEPAKNDPDIAELLRTRESQGKIKDE